jgi:hypothetical protein
MEVLAMNPRSALTIAALVASSSLTGCLSEGIGSGELETPVATTNPPQPVGPVAFTWHSDGQISTRGTIGAILPDGRSFEGRYWELLSQQQVYDPADVSRQVGPTTPPPVGSLSPYFAGGNEVTHYSGRLLATLRSPDGSWMVCWFNLTEPRSGPAAGAKGNCELSGGGEIEHASLSQPPPAKAPQPESPSRVSVAHRD